MSSRSRALIGSHPSQTPTRFTPSTPHAIRALQQRSGANARSVRRRRAVSDTVRPDSARGILRQLAKITAPVTRKVVPTPDTARGKENKTPKVGRPVDDGQDEEQNVKRPRLTLDIDESLESIEIPQPGDDEDSELPAAPTPSILPEDDGGENHDPTFTLRSIDYRKQAHSPDNSRRISRRSFPVSDPVGQVSFNGGDEDSTFLSERGRRAETVEPTENLSRYDFGLIDMDGFHSELEIRRESHYQGLPKSPEKIRNDLVELDPNHPSPREEGGETEALRGLQYLQRSPSLAPPDESTMHIPALDDSNFQLPVPDVETTSKYAQGAGEAKLVETSPSVDRQRHSQEVFEREAEPEDGQPSNQSLVDEEELRPAPQQHRRKKLKLTRHGEMVPSLPSSLIRRVATEAQARLGNRRPKLGKDHIQALEQATEWYFEQIGEDLEAYSTHARRKRIDQSDVLMLMHRQRLLQSDGELLKAAKELLPKDVAASLDLEELSDH
ncbi:uncharacterized protein Z520_02045 [Fonsecaea multimorphosa CBS 102226]|uniref:CENP-T/Histone H4 histone fold domain-containing protein n=1 Tax=Fonsecaea multimorphosa CBS 102226 TaxID=1442371 RepID=A0A0D2IY27_9EURO|nr:uncharacterized protein Z520_02045 [Fonsecaea multimorphosa CBS 102226]KIY01907.1 hypothetical protein Z520_02045 [Fonsecaea multimorphosa CBS 102226]OAL29590.1 hypothetical protein AYO22_02004 [Fonsecaea multimorphosa]